MSCRSSRIKVPTTSYKVRHSDTVFSIAAQFNVTPAEVKTLNRLSHSSELFPDQVIRVPDLDALAELEKERQEREAEEERERQLQAANNLAASPRGGPGLASRVTPSSPSSHSCSVTASVSLEEPRPLSTEESVRERQFVKSEHARLITDGEGCVSGTLIITPQTLMFDPSVHDRLVQERGQAYFQWQIELRQVRTVAVYSDPRAMRLMVGDSSRIGNPDLSEAEMRMELNEEDHRFVETSSRAIKEEEEPGPEGGDMKTEEKTADDDDEKQDKLTLSKVADEKQIDDDSSKKEKLDVDDNVEVAEETSVNEEETSVNEEETSPKEEEKVEKNGETSPKEEEKGEKEEETTPKEDEEVEKEEEKVEREEEKSPKEDDTVQKEEEKTESSDKSEERTKVTMSDSTEMESDEPKTKDEDDDKDEGFDLRPSQPSSPLDYLCILYKPLAPGSWSFPFLSASPKADEPRLPDRGQHWFTLPHEKNKELLAFLKDSHPEEMDSGGQAGAMAVSPSSGAVSAIASPNATSSAPGESLFVLQENHFANTPPKDEDPRSQRLHMIRQQSLDWELINRDEVSRAMRCDPSCLAAGMSIDEDLLIPELIGENRVLQHWMLKDIVRNLPSRAEGCLTLELAYSTHKHGFSLNSLYRKCRRESEDKPCLLLIRSQKCPPDSCFGAVLSSHLHVSEAFYGTGETYLLRWRPNFEKFVWSGSNNYIIKGSNKSIMIGSSNGAVALYIDEGLYRGRSQVCDTFLMPCPLTSDDQEDFVIENLEVWDFK